MRCFREKVIFILNGENIFHHLALKAVMLAAAPLPKFYIDLAVARRRAKKMD